MWNSISQDLRHAFRTMLKSPGFTGVAVLTLVLGIGATTAIFSVVYSVLLRSLPYHASSRLVHVLADDPGDPRSGISYQAFEPLGDQNRSFEDIAVYYRNTGFSRVTISGGADPESVQGGFTSASFFGVLGVAPRLGRVFGRDEESRGEPVAVISTALWKRRFALDPGVLGRAIEVDGRAFTVIGVMPPEFQFPARETQLWLPITTHRLWSERPYPDDRPNYSRGYYMRWNGVARLRSSVSRDTAQAEISALSNRLAEQDRNWNLGLGVKVVPLSVEVTGEARVALMVLLGSVGLVLLIACSNVANLMLARGASRAHEMAIRTALGAGQRRLMRQVLTESVALVAISACIASLLAAVATRLLVRFGPPDLPRLEEARIDGPVLGFTIGISLLSAFAFGLFPALRASRSDPGEALKAGKRGAIGSPGRNRASGLLVISEFAVSLILLSGSGLLIRSLVEVGRVDLGFQPDRVLSMRVRLPDGTPESRRMAFSDELLNRLRSTPGVQFAGGIGGLFEPGRPMTNSLRAVEGRLLEQDQSGPLTWTTVSGDYFQAMGVPLLAGRFFSDRDGPNAPLVAIVDESMARRYWPNGNPIGKRFKGQDARGRDDEWLTVVGLVRNARRQGLERESTPHVFEWHRQAGPNSADWVVRTAGEPAQLAAVLRRIVRDIDSRGAVTNLMTLEQHIDLQTSARRFQTWLLTLFSILALALAATGIYGVISYSTAQRTHEIGIRMALGAERANVLAIVMRQGLSFAAVGLASGLLASWWVARVFERLLYGVAPTDLPTFAGAAVILFGVAAIATLLPAWRASRLDPLAALRAD